MAASWIPVPLSLPRGKQMPIEACTPFFDRHWLGPQRFAGRVSE